MSVYQPDAFEREQSVDDLQPPDICFHCGGVLSSDDVLVYMSGSVGSPFLTDEEAYHHPRPMLQIWLHTQCAHALAMDLLKDYFAVKEVTDYKEARARLGFPPA